MPTISNTSLTLTTVNSDVTVRVQYEASFTKLEQFLASNGLRFKEKITVRGYDAIAGGANETLYVFPVPTGGIPVPTTGSLTVSRDRSATVTRDSLQEDSGNDDEIVCNIEIEPIGLPVAVSGLTPEQVLLG